MATIEAELTRAEESIEAGARFESLMLDFLAYLEFERGLSQNTLSAYRTDLLQFGRFLAGLDADATKATAQQLAEFLASLADGVESVACTPATSTDWAPSPRKTRCGCTPMRSRPIHPCCTGSRPPSVAATFHART